MSDGGVAPRALPRWRGDGPGPVRRHGDPPVWEFGPLRLRRYTPADHATVLRLHRDGLAQVGLKPGDGVYYDHDFFRMRELYLGDDGEFLVGEVDGETVAMGGLRRADLVPGGRARAFGAFVPGSVALDAVEMVRLRVHPAHQGRGYGAVLVHTLEERAAELGYRLLKADTTSQQTAALALYRSFGWRETRRERIGAFTNVYLEKHLR
ncbi:GNAT family N-acetyltransferase [Actinomadura flavalba]|uniref:GNAT family N-acetyltransferase n=1 Tax=Actinomadura flavalba TaxID=1120938 RepID=UPI00036AE313|nr:GNAT family N-acetyltransferase [Actinomadura flavalba]